MNKICSNTAAFKISEAIRNCEPFSYIRYSDGDAMFMNDNPLCEKILFNESLPEPFRSGFKDDLFQAYNNADILGLPDPDEISRSMWYLQAYLMNGINYSGICSSSRDPVNWHDKLYIEMFESLTAFDKLFIITSHDISERFLRHFNIEPYIIPIGKPGRGADEHIKEYINFMHRSIEPGLYLVSWGIFAKTACDYIKQCGGIALDVGAIIDGWMGLKTRSYHKEKNYEI